VAPCEVVPKDPILITAPLDGIVEEVKVQPGIEAKKGTILFEYDKRVPLQDLKVAQKEVEIGEKELNRATALGLTDPKSLAELAILRLRLEKKKIDLQLAEYQASRLTVYAPEEGVIMLDDPEKWRGKPVKVGEKVMIVSDPNLTKVRIWIPESDNIILDPAIPIKVFLNINPEISREAKLIYIANYATISEKEIPSFMAEAEWIKPQKDIKLGLKGTAILYGTDVSLFYYLIRKPWARVRSFFGV
jgi:hypothetical protein